ncbi:hypothetical protein FQZ97_1132470 [compost metagenome]
MSDRPAVAFIDEMHGGQQQVDRHPRLLHVAVGVAEENVAVGTDHHQPVANTLHVGERFLAGVGGFA